MGQIALPSAVTNQTVKIGGWNPFLFQALVLLTQASLLLKTRSL